MRKTGLWLLIITFFGVGNTFASVGVPIATPPIRWDPQAGGYYFSIGSMGGTSPAQKELIPQGVTQFCMAPVKEGKFIPYHGYWGQDLECLSVGDSQTWAELYQRYITYYSSVGFVRIRVAEPNTTPPPAAELCFEPVAIRDISDRSPYIGPDTICMHPNPSNVTCSFLNDGAEFDFGSVNSGEGQTVSKDIGVNCTGDVKTVMELSGGKGAIAVFNASGESFDVPVAFDDRDLSQSLQLSMPAGDSQHHITARLPTGTLPAGDFSGTAVLIINPL
ncbi:hypothetical protein [Intestinirhabdus alba]|jgi:hypothetical protein|uniref:Fimbrial protein n=1 Tax=Intestinirhabdus alba TaxID=2899544 RepID=A0A6L6IH94_9ENTR|nr:hypothetical protein [Intestinirhabdus alba]MTH44966.1 hypothetical protein [Intestinirhabdus alba]